MLFELETSHLILCGRLYPHQVTFTFSCRPRNCGINYFPTSPLHLGGSLIILKSLQLVSFTDSFVQLLSALQTVFLPLEKQNSLIYCQKADDFFASTARWRCCCCCCFPCFPGKDQIRRHCLSIVDPVTTKYHDYFYFFKFDVPYN